MEWRVYMYIILPGPKIFISPEQLNVPVGEKIARTSLRCPVKDFHHEIYCL